MEGAVLVPWWLSLAGQGSGERKKKLFLDTTVPLLSFLQTELRKEEETVLKYSCVDGACISYVYLSLDSAGWKGISFTLAAITKSNYSRTSRRVWGDEQGAIGLCVLRRSKSSDVWRLCPVNIIAAMFRFSCFHANVQGNKAKKAVQPSTEAMVKGLQDVTQNHGCKDSSNPPSTYSSPLKEEAHKKINVIENHFSNWDSVECSCRSEDLNSKFSFEYDSDVHQTRGLKKSQSLQSGLDQGIIREGDEDLGLSCDGAKSHNESTISICGKNHDASPTDQYGNNPNLEFQVSSGLANDSSIFSIGDPTPSDKDAREISDTPLSGEFSGDVADQASVLGTLPLRKSHSVPNTRASGKVKCVLSLSRSSDDLHTLRMRQKEVFTIEFDDQIRGDQERENDMGKTEDGQMDSLFDDGLDSYLLSSSAKDWVMPFTDDTSDVKNLQGDSSVDCAGEFPNKDFKIKRIEDWVIGLQHCAPPLEETNELPEAIEPLAVINTTNGVIAASVDHKVTPGMEAAKRYISSLSANATAAQLANHGLVVIPFLSAFVSLKVLNLSGNAVVRITAGALPRGLHALNLSRNKISSIEGLRELTRLRVLDLSYNRILRIGHGLASCSSLKELYLAGNKISEVEGLHRLLKLSILDLRFNKISTAKCLGQLAANYVSLQAINLDGNPAQKNVGDEQMKKYLQGLLPHLVYYNRQPIKVSTLKDGGERSVRLGMNSHQFDRSLRADRKTPRKGSQGVAATRRPSTASTHVRRSVDSPKLNKGKQALLPPTRTKVSTQTRYQFDAPSKVLNLTSDRSSIRKSRSEGNFEALWFGFCSS
ncbi:Protein phosphatase 1 regulatory subunit pprA, partial [Mucuna pruriens]